MFFDSFLSLKFSFSLFRVTSKLTYNGVPSLSYIDLQKQRQPRYKS